MHTILGANGTIARGAAEELYKNNQKIRLVSRNPKKMHDSDELVQADLLDAAQTSNAIKGSDTVYLVTGLIYKTKIWQEQWPVLMQNVINGCKEHGAKLLFFDNVYSYGLVKGPMTESTPINPVSKKGEVRAGLVEMLMSEMKNGLPVIIARAADFYGSGSPLSFLNEIVIKKIAAGQKPMVLANANKLHSLTYIPDAGKATAMLGMSDNAWNQVWHVPTAGNPMTMKQIIEAASEIAGTKSSGYQLLPKWMIQLVGIFMPVLKESVEMLYQNEYDYIFDSTKFDTAFNFEPTPYLQGIKESLEFYRK